MQTKALLLLALSITLAACGSSSNKSNLTDSNISGSTGNIGSNTGDNTGGNTGGNAAKNEGLLLPADSFSPRILTSNTRTSISVDGHTISLVPTAKYPVNFLQSYSSFGKVELSGIPYLYSIGEITKLSDMPTSGKATYNGGYFEVGHNSATNKSYEQQGDFIAKVDFANKSIDGAIRSGNYVRSFEAKIDGSSFTGTGTDSKTVNVSNFTGTRDKLGNVEGRFYGPQASEIGGVYHSQTSDYAISGSFGGTRD